MKTLFHKENILPIKQILKSTFGNQNFYKILIFLGQL